MDAEERRGVQEACGEIIRGLLQCCADANPELRCIVIKAIGFFSTYLQYADEQQLFFTFHKLLTLSGQQSAPGDGPRAARRGASPFAPCGLGIWSMWGLDGVFEYLALFVCLFVCLFICLFSRSCHFDGFAALCRGLLRVSESDSQPVSFDSRFVCPPQDCHVLHSHSSPTPRRPCHRGEGSDRGGGWRGKGATRRDAVCRLDRAREQRGSEPIHIHGVG